MILKQKKFPWMSQWVPTLKYCAKSKPSVTIMSKFPYNIKQQDDFCRQKLTEQDTTPKPVEIRTIDLNFQFYNKPIAKAVWYAWDLGAK